MTYEPALFADMAGRTVAVTGAARGIGEATVLALARNGVNVVAGDLDESAMTATAEGLREQCRHGATIVPMRVDVTRAEDHHALAQGALERFGALDGWINNAGVYATGGVLETSGEEITLRLLRKRFFRPAGKRRRSISFSMNLNLPRLKKK